MSGANWLQLAALVVVVLVSVPLLGAYLARMLGSGRAPGDRVFAPVERVIYRVVGVDAGREQRWSVYALSLLAFSAVSVIGLFFIQPDTGLAAAEPDRRRRRAAGACLQHRLELYDEHELAELRRRVDHEPPQPDRARLAVQNFVSAAVGIAVAVALVRGLTRRRSETIGNFWVDVTRVTVRVLVPIALVIALALASQGVVQSLRGPADAMTL